VTWSKKWKRIGDFADVRFRARHKRRVAHMKIRVTLLDLKGLFVAEVNAPAEATGFFGDEYRPAVLAVIWRGRAFVRETPDRVFREFASHVAAHRAPRR
jgi:hypothetical protein